MLIWQLLVAIAVVAAASPSAAASKTLVYALYGQPETLDSAKAESERSIHATWLLCDALINVSHDGARLEPALAESWTLTADGLRATFHLRPGTTFHDGSLVDAAAVKASFERQFRPGHELYTSAPPNTKEQLLSDLIDEIQTDGAAGVSFKLKYPGVYHLSQVDVINPDALRAAGRDFGKAPVCSGPYKFESRSRDDVTLAVNERYWGGRAHIDRVVFRAFHEPKALVEALLRGDAHYAPTIVDTIYLERVRESTRLRVVPLSGLNIHYLGFDTERPPFDARTLRRAVAQAIDVQRMVKFLGRGTAVPASGPIPPALAAYDPSIAQLPHNVEAARQLVSKQGAQVSGPVTLLHNSAGTLHAELAGAVKSYLRPIGLDVHLLGKPTWGELSTALQRREANMFLYSWHVRAPYPERILVPLFHSGAIGKTNFTRYSNATVDRLLQEALRLLPGQEQRRVYGQIQSQLVDDAPMVFLFHVTRIAVIREGVEHLRPNLMGLPADKLIGVNVTR